MAKLIKRRTDDGLFEIEDHISLGKEYRIDLDTLQIGTGVNSEKEVWWEREIVFMNDTEWFPTELLDFTIE